MKINCGPTPEGRANARYERLTNWHPFFCLWPRRLGPNDCRWLETVERRGDYRPVTYGGDGGYSWKFRAMEAT